MLPDHQFQQPQQPLRPICTRDPPVWTAEMYVRLRATRPELLLLLKTLTRSTSLRLVFLITVTVTILSWQSPLTVLLRQS